MKTTILLSFVLFLLVSCADSKPPAMVQLKILATTDLHCHIMDYDYYRDIPSIEFGLARTASLIAQERKLSPNVLLFDNGDLIQGNPMGDWVAKVQGLPKGAIHPVYKAMNRLQYDAAGFGNHEFNYGLDFLQKALSGAKFPYVCSNIYVADNTTNKENTTSTSDPYSKPYFQPYTILQRTFLDDNNQPQNLRIGVLAVLPLHIMKWDAEHLTGKVVVQKHDEAIKKWLPVVKAQGADIIVVLAHAGPGYDPEENSVLLLSEIPGVDAIIAGHSHDAFPLTEETKIPGAVSAQAWGGHLGVISLTLEKQENSWKVAKSTSIVKPISQRKDGKVIALVEPNLDVVTAVVQEHESTLDYIRQKIGQTAISLHTYFAQTHDNSALELIGQSQRWYAAEKLKNTPYADLPILSATAPFKCGGRGGPANYTDVPAGTLSLKSMANLYVYPNTLKAVLLNGDEVREWLEMSAGQFRYIRNDDLQPQQLLNDDFQSFNFDVLDGVTFTLDITKPARYDSMGKLANANSHRISELAYQGKTVTPDQKFIVVTNNFRAHGGGNFPNLKGKNIIYSSPDEVRQILVSYVQQKQTVNPTPDQNWKFAPWPKELQVVFVTSPQASSYAKDFSNVEFLRILENGFALYRLHPQK